MNETQKQYSVLKIKKHKQELKKLEQKDNTNKCFLYGCIGLAVVSFKAGNKLEEINTIARYIFEFIGWTGVAVGIDNLSKMIFNIIKKAGLENAIDRIDYEMKMSEFEESNEKRGPRR